MFLGTVGLVTSTRWKSGMPRHQHRRRRGVAWLLHPGKIERSAHGADERSNKSLLGSTTGARNQTLIYIRREDVDLTKLPNLTAWRCLPFRALQDRMYKDGVDGLIRSRITSSCARQRTKPFPSCTLERVQQRAPGKQQWWCTAGVRPFLGRRLSPRGGRPRGHDENGKGNDKARARAGERHPRGGSYCPFLEVAGKRSHGASDRVSGARGGSLFFLDWERYLCGTDTNMINTITIKVWNRV